MVPMGMPEGPNVLVNRQAVLLATGVGVGLLTLVYVLGVQVGKQSAALHAGTQANGAELKELPSPLTEQLKAFEVEVSQTEKTRAEPPKAEEPTPAAPKPAAPKPAAPKAAAPAKAEPKKDAPKPEPKKEPLKSEAKKEAPKAEAGAAKAEPGERWTQQLITTTDPAEAKRIAARAREAGYETLEVKTGESIRVRIKGRMSKPDADAAGAKLKEKGLKPFAVKVD